MTDIFREVDEEFKRDQFAQFLKKHGTLVVAGLVLFVAVVGGWRGYQWYNQKQAAAAGVRYEEAMRLSGEGKDAEAKTMLDALAADAPAGYRQLARLRLAGDLARTDPAAAIKAFDALAADTTLDQNFRDLASVRAGVLSVDTAPLDEVVRRLEPFAAPTQAWRMSAREGLATAAFKAGDTARATRFLDAILADPEATQQVRQRGEVLMALIRASAPAAK